MKKSIFIFIIVVTCLFSCNHRNKILNEQGKIIFHCSVEGIFVSPQEKYGTYTIILKMSATNESNDTIYFSEKSQIPYHGIPNIYRSYIEGEFMNQPLDFIEFENMGGVKYLQPHYKMFIILSCDDFFMPNNGEINSDSLRSIKLKLRYSPLNDNALHKVVFDSLSNTPVYIMPSNLNQFTAYKILGTKRVLFNGDIPSE